MFAKSSAVLCALALVSGVFSAPVTLSARQNPCFIVGNTALPAEISDGLAALSGVTCNAAVQPIPGIPDVISGGISYSSIDFQKSKLSPVGFALATFTTPCDPAKADLDLLQNQLNTYLAVEAALRSQSGTSSAVLGRLKGPKFFLQFQIARVKTAQGQTLGVADTVEHQLGKVTKNAVGASADEIAQVTDLASIV